MATMLRNEVLSEARALQRGLLAGWPMPVIDKLKVKDMIASLPGYGKAKVAKIMEELGISETRRIKGLGTRQREALIEKLSK